jgi:hypothetical protein
VPLPSPNLAEAKKLVTEAKAAGRDGKIRLACTNTPARLATALGIRTQLEAVGMTVDDAKTAAFKKISEAWANDAPSIPIAHVEERVEWGAKVRGLSTTAQNQVVFTKAWIGS